MSVLAYWLEPVVGAKLALPAAWVLTIAAITALWLLFGCAF